MHIQRLRLLGFKSFVEPTDLLIEKGLTGIVGPNGCGKSNLLEALRWVMGETSYKSMRASAMEDVIFSGTTSRPPRNSAEVTLIIDNRDRKAPAEFNDSDIIEVTRRIERDAGSTYRINGREVRARDVKILFEDAATGARSPALVRQGQIGEIVNAKPEQRRRILEDAAGIAGLHSRRHEAELRLNAAEANLARISDILGQLNSQLENLKRQARQVKRYKEISAEIRRAEALLLYLQWKEAQAQVEAEEAALTEVTTRLGVAVRAESEAVRREAEIAQSLQALRDEEATRAAVLARVKVEQETFEREVERTREREAELKDRMAQLARDIEREDEHIREARQILAQLDAELEADLTADQHSTQQEEAVSGELAIAQEELERVEAELQELTARAAEARTKRQNLMARLAERRDEIAKLERELAGLEAQARDIAARAPEAAKLAELQELVRQLTLELAELETNAVGAEERVTVAAEQAKRAREASRQAELVARQLATELATLGKLLMPAQNVPYPPVVDLLEVTPGYEQALGAALGDDLEAPIAPEAAAHWRLVEAMEAEPALPEGVEPLIAYVDGPPELARRLAQVGVVPRELGDKLQPALKPGQRLVSREGDLWRWDGFVAAADAPTPAAQRLAERNRLVELRHREAEARELANAAAAEAIAAAERHRRAEEEERQLRQAWREAQSRLAKSREQLNAIERAARETEGRLAAVAEAKERVAARLAEARERLAETEADLNGNDDSENYEPLIAAAQQRARAVRETVAQLRASLAALERERKLREERAARAVSERERWLQRAASAERQIGTLKTRLDETKAELDRLAQLPPLIEEKRQALLNALSQAERERKTAADQLAAAENAQREAAQAVKAAQAAVAEEREARARVEARLEAARRRRSEEVARIRDTFNVVPEACLEIAELKPGAELPKLSDVDRLLTRLRADRERLGGVNLQAEEELQSLQEQYAKLDAERVDVEAAIAKLRAAIGQLNREARKRLQSAFDVVNGHFQRLFTTLFGGGEARLEMIENEDPLQGGLEIIARPPGKKPATLSLLSGGEQTLTALSLIFAVFLTNPSPICVLDEVDAPLDDANVDRFCTLMERMAEETETRFLVITHHPMTMARMDRLFGVTMAEKGVSQLVSVDLASAERFLEAV